MSLKSCGCLEHIGLQAQVRASDAITVDETYTDTSVKIGEKEREMGHESSILARFIDDDYYTRHSYGALLQGVLNLHTRETLFVVIFGLSWWNMSDGLHNRATV